jgi:periplasmic divalent cation tolerance protein
MENVMVYMTFPGIDEAKKTGALIVEKRLAACVNIIEGMTSMYWWESRIETATEVVVIAKTRKDLMDKLTAFVKSVHSYKIPCIVSVPITGGNPDFLKWIEEETLPT